MEPDFVLYNTCIIILAMPSMSLSVSVRGKVEAPTLQELQIPRLEVLTVSPIERKGKSYSEFIVNILTQVVWNKKIARLIDLLTNG